MGGEVPIWVGGLKKWVTGVTKLTTCDDVIKAILASSNGKTEKDWRHYGVMERWRKVERKLEGKCKILKVWKAWGDEQKNVRLMVKKIHSSIESPESIGTSETLADYKYKAIQHTKRKYGRSPTSRSPRAQSWHPNKIRSMSPEVMEKHRSESTDFLLKLITSQGDTINDQIKQLMDKDEEIEYYENKIHLLRMEQSGVNYVLDTYLGDVNGNCDISDTSEERTNVILSMYTSLLELYNKLEYQEKRIHELISQISHTSTLCAVGSIECTEKDLDLLKAEVGHLTAINDNQKRTIDKHDSALRECIHLMEDRDRKIRELIEEIEIETTEECHLYHELQQLSIESEETTVKQVSSSNCEKVTVQAENEMVTVTASPIAVCASSEANDAGSDTGISSLHSSSDEGGYVLATLV